MPMIRLITSKEEQSLERHEVMYLFSSLIRFNHNNEGSILRDGYKKLSGDSLAGLIKLVDESRRELLDQCYEEPSARQRQKHPTFFEKLIIDDKKYVVNYTTSIVGRLIYTLSIRLDFMAKAALEEGKLTIECQGMFSRTN